MEPEQFKAIREKLQLTESELSEPPSLTNLNSITSKALYSIHYSDLSIHSPDAPETCLEWGTIFRRLVTENKPGCCYERSEVLYQLLVHLGYETVRLEALCVWSGKASTSRHEHMALGIRLDDDAWYIVDSAWALLFSEGAIKLGNGIVTETGRMTMRTVHAKTRGDDVTNVKSELDERFMRHWDIEYRSPRVEHVDFDDFIEMPNDDNEWKCIFSFNLERQELNDFADHCHAMHHNENELCNFTSFIAWDDKIEYRNAIHSRHVVIIGKEQVETIFIAPDHHVQRVMKYDTVKGINETCAANGVIIEYENWQPASKFNCIKDPRDE